MALTKQQMVQEAFELALPSMEALFASKRTKAELAFCFKVSRRFMHAGVWVSETLLQYNFGEPVDWEVDFSEIVDGKTRITTRTGLSSREVHLMHPELLDFDLEDDDVIYWGSLLVGDLVPAGSGVQAYFDEALAEVFGAFYKAICADEKEIRTCKAKDRDSIYLNAA